MSHRFPRAPFAVTRQLSRQRDLRLCRSAPAGSIPAPASTFIVRTEESLTAFLEVERAIHQICGDVELMTRAHG